MLLRYEQRKGGKSMTFGELTSRKSSDFEYAHRLALGVVPGDGIEVWGKYI
jgi:hypothetical protein